jgi:isopentenyl-diphosphate delta-isomerase
MMAQDMLITVSPSDEILGSASKYTAHRFNTETPHGELHRAFSVFLFNERNEMLLTKRAATKITFPNHWTNACCSHPLHGIVPSEVDDNAGSHAAGSRGDVKHEGARNAAVRKLKHELGITTLARDDFTFLTRFRYWAADVETYGKEKPDWGEHEVDYIFVARKNVADIDLDINLEEVEGVEWVSPAALGAMTGDDKRMFSPWFKGIMAIKGDHYWENLDEIIKNDGEGFKDSEIHSFETEEEYKASFH